MLSSLQTFVTLYETRNFSKTAQLLFISQPAVTARIKKLEETLNTLLFSRINNKEVIPTCIADQFYFKAVRLLSDWDKTQTEISSIINNKTSFNLGLSPNSASLFEIPILDILKPYLDILNLKIQIFDSQTIFNLVKTHELHFGIIERMYNHECITRFDILDDELVLAGNLSSDNFFVRKINFETAPFTKKFMKEDTFKYKNSINVNNINTILNYINREMGTSIISKNLLTKNTPYQKLSKEYMRTFSGIYYTDEQDRLILEIIDKLKMELEKINIDKL